MAKPLCILGYSGHGYVAIEIFQSTGRRVEAYCDSTEKSSNPFSLRYLGSETEVLEQLKRYDYFIATGDNAVRRRVHEFLLPHLGEPANAVHAAATISPSATFESGVMVAAGA